MGFIFFIRILETQGDERIGLAKKGKYLIPNSSPRSCLSSQSIAWYEYHSNKIERGDKKKKRALIEFLSKQEKQEGETVEVQKK